MKLHQKHGSLGGKTQDCQAKENRKEAIRARFCSISLIDDLLSPKWGFL